MSDQYQPKPREWVVKTDREIAVQHELSPEQIRQNAENARQERRLQNKRPYNKEFAENQALYKATKNEQEVEEDKKEIRKQASKEKIEKAVKDTCDVM